MAETKGEVMTNYKYFIYRIESDPNAAGEYIGPFTTREQRDVEAQRMRSEDRKVISLHRGVSIYRADIADEVVDSLGSQDEVAA
ncbi:MAG: hypothetical protein AAF458_06690 [Pseudomonadota bacterium]